MKILTLLALVTVLACTSPKAIAQTANTPVARLNHLAIYVADLKITTDFYKSLFNLEIIANPFNDNKHTWFNLGNGAAFHVIEGAKVKGVFAKNEHLCFSVPSVEVFVKSLKAQSIKFENVAGTIGEITARVDGVKQIYFQDPDGHWLEVNDAK